MRLKPGWVHDTISSAQPVPALVFSPFITLYVDARFIINIRRGLKENVARDLFSAPFRDGAMPN
jgi:hypothetical protein